MTTLPTLISNANHASNSGNVMTFTKPTVTTGDLMLVAIFHQSQYTVTTPTGWTRVAHVGGASGTEPAIEAYTRFIDGSEGATFSFSFTNSSNAMGQILQVRGVDTANTIDVNTNDSGFSSSSSTPATLTTRLDNELIISAASTFKFNDTTYTLSGVPGGATQISSQASSAYRLAVAQRSATTAGSYGGSFTWSVANDWTAFRIALRPTGGNIPPTVAIGADAASPYGAAISRSATASDPEGAVTYSWSITSKPTGSTATLSGATTATASYKPDLPGAYAIACTVTDTGGATATDTATDTIIATHWVRLNGQPKAAAMRSRLNGTLH